MSSLGWLASDFMEYSPSSCADATCSLVKEAGAMADRVNSRRLGTPAAKGFSETEILIARPTGPDTCDLKHLWLRQIHIGMGMQLNYCTSRRECLELET